MQRKTNSSNLINISSPIAESTRLNKTNLSNQFPWGGINPVQKYANKGKSPLSNSSIKTSTVRKTIIDPRTYTDIQSRGLTSRIVKYHDESMKLGRSLSTSSLYSKPGQFPIVHLSKSPIQYKANKNKPISIVRIAPPDKAVFQANTRSSILRSSSIVSTVNMMKTNSEFSCENRPIIHPIENDIMPTRSVLDALKEISRKRIISDDLDGNDDAKKYCRDSEDIDRTTCSGLLPSATVMTSPSNTSGMKRQISPTSKLNCLEQTNKKRMHSINNDILSSLSSSLNMITPKRKLSEIRSSSTPPSHEKTNSGLNNKEPFTISENSIQPKTKQYCNENNKLNTNFSTETKKFRKHLEVETPFPCIPATLKEQQESPLSTDQDKNKLIEPSMNKKSIEVIEPVKPKITLFNKNYEDEDFKRKIETRKNLRKDENIYSNKVEFVKPRNDISLKDFEMTKPVVQKMKQSRLALMLKGLRGESDEDENDEDETDTAKLNETQNQENVSQSNITKSDAEKIINETLPVTTSASISFGTNTTISTSTISSPAVTVSPKTTFDPSTSIKGVDNNNDFSFGLKTNSVSNTNSNTSISMTSSIATTSKTTPIFSFETTKLSDLDKEKSKEILNTSNVTTTSSNINISSGFSFGVPKSTVNEISTTGSSLSLSTTPFTSNVTTSATNENISSENNQKTTLPPSQNFNFGKENMPSGFNEQPQKSTSGPTSTSATPTNMFSFNNNNNAENNSLFNIPKFNPKPIFGNISATSTPTTTISTLSNSSNPGTSLAFNSTTFNAQSQVKPSNNEFGIPKAETNQEKITPVFNSQNNSTFGNVKLFSSSGNLNGSAKNIFENKQPSNTFIFGDIRKTEAATISKENSTTTLTFESVGSMNTKGGFSFNPTTQTTTNTSSTTGSQFTFINNKNQLSSPFSTGNQIQSSSGFSFTAAGSTDNKPEVSQNAPFSFSISNQQSQAQAPNPIASTPSFSFGNNSINNKPISFNFGNTAPNTTSSTSSFSFSNVTSQNSFGSFANKNGSGSLTFGGSSVSNDGNSKSTGFGTFSVISKSQTQPLQQTSAFSFSSQTNNKNEVKPPNQQSSFGNVTTPKIGQNLFGESSVGQTKIFNFNSSLNSANSNKSSTASQNIFGGISSTSTTASTISTFGSVGSQLGKAQTTTGFSFGTNANLQNSSNTPFSFGSNPNSKNSGNKQVEPIKSFTFGSTSSTNLNQPSVNVFGSSNSNSSGLNFSSQINNNNASENPFNTNFPTADRRKIIKASRRLGGKSNN